MAIVTHKHKGWQIFTLFFYLETARNLTLSSRGGGGGIDIGY